MNEHSEQTKHPFNSPSTEYCKFKNYNSPKDIDHKTEVSNHDLLVALLLAADGIFHELINISKSLEK